MTLGREVMVDRGMRPLVARDVKRRLVAIQEDQAKELGLQRLHLKYYKKRALKRLLNRKPYYRYPRVESYYRTCDYAC